jgi:L-ascorbate metabolism protein UlaG (beta-lactamase superfamily)
MELTWFGHASVRIVTKEGVVIYIDPFAGDEGWYDKQADLVLVTHNDYDHLKESLMHKLIGDDCVILGPSAVRTHHQEVKPVWPNESHEIKGVKIKVVDAYAIGKKVHPKGEGVGYVLEFDGTSVYVAGDTDFIPEMRKIRADIVVLPVGGTFTMSAKEAAEVVLGMKPKHAIPYHWGSIVGHLDDAENFKDIVDSAGLTTVHIMHPDQTVQL